MHVQCQPVPQVHFGRGHQSEGTGRGRRLAVALGGPSIFVILVLTSTVSAHGGRCGRRPTSISGPSAHIGSLRRPGRTDAGHSVSVVRAHRNDFRPRSLVPSASVDSNDSEISCRDLHTWLRLAGSAYLHSGGSVESDPPVCPSRRPPVVRPPVMQTHIIRVRRPSHFPEQRRSRWVRSRRAPYRARQEKARRPVIRRLLFMIWRNELQRTLRSTLLPVGTRSQRSQREPHPSREPEQREHAEEHPVDMMRPRTERPR
jgi:hypothetical protein